jgi:hypothetical protein
MVLGFGVFFAVAREGERPRGWTLSLLAFLGIGLGIAGLGLLGTRWASSKITLNRGTRTLRESRWNAEESVGTPSKLNGWRLVVVMILCLLATFFVAAVFLLTQSRGVHRACVDLAPADLDSPTSKRSLVQPDYSHCSFGPTWVRHCFPLGGGAHLGHG